MADPWVLYVHGTFDSTAAGELGEALLALTPGRGALVDFTHASGVQDAALGALSGALQARGTGVQMRGLSKHQLTLLRLLGVGARE